MICVELRRAIALALFVALALPAAAQVTDQPAIKIKAPKPKKEKFKGEVLHATRTSITVRSRDNYNLVRTFTYEEKLATKIGKQFDNNKIYQHGDRVQIIYLAGTDGAVKIKGKPGQKRRD